MAVVRIGEVCEVENYFSEDCADALRIKVRLPQEKKKKAEELPWAVPLLPKTFQTIPHIGEAVFVFMDEESNIKGQRHYLGPIISQPQYFEECEAKNATSIFSNSQRRPIGKISNYSITDGAFPDKKDVAVIGRGREDLILRYDSVTKASEATLRAGIRGEPVNDPNPDLIGNIIFNSNDPAYIQVKYKTGLARGRKTRANSIVNVVANRINLMSNLDTTISHNLNDQETLVKEAAMDEIMEHLHPVPKGDKLVELLTIMKNAILGHVHPQNGMPQSGDSAGEITKLQSFAIEDILSDYVRTS